MERDMPAMLQMYHAGLARLQSNPYASYGGISALWPTHGHMAPTFLPQQPSQPLFRPTEDSCGGSSRSSDTNGSDTNSGDEVSFKKSG